LISDSYKIKIKIQGLDSMPRFDFYDENNLYYKTYITQEFLKRNILASNSIYICTEHNIKIFNRYFDILDEIFLKISKSIKKKDNPKDLLNGPVCISGIRSNN
jgi:glutamate-1-semialdehyde 2,1-aminomutase